MSDVQKSASQRASCIRGMVMDSSNTKPIHDAHITVRWQAIPHHNCKETATGIDGRFVVDKLPDEDVEIHVRCRGYAREIFDTRGIPSQPVAIYLRRLEKL